MNTDGHGWDDADQAGDIAAVNRAAAANSLSDPCSIRVHQWLKNSRVSGPGPDAGVAREFGARVFDFVWVDDFAAARNAALARATGDYAFWLDADDVIDPPEREKLQALLGSLRPWGNNGAGDGGLRFADPPYGYVLRCSCDPGPNGDGGQTVVDHIRLFPLREDVRWSYRVHEQILPALRRANVPVKWTDITVRHTGYTDRATRAEAPARRQDSRRRAVRAAERSVRAVQPGRDRGRAARLAALDFSGGAWPARRRVIRSRGSCSR